jgi:hypothetical protein
LGRAGGLARPAPCAVAPRPRNPLLDHAPNTHFGFLNPQSAANALRFNVPEAAGSEWIGRDERQLTGRAGERPVHDQLAVDSVGSQVDIAGPGEGTTINVDADEELNIMERRQHSGKFPRVETERVR